GDRGQVEPAEVAPPVDAVLADVVRVRQAGDLADRVPDGDAQAEGVAHHRVDRAVDLLGHDDVEAAGALPGAVRAAGDGCVGLGAVGDGRALGDARPAALVVLAGG